MKYETKQNKYRYDQYGSVYIFDCVADAYVFIGKLNGDTIRGFVEDYEYNLNPEYDYD